MIHQEQGRMPGETGDPALDTPPTTSGPPSHGTYHSRPSDRSLCRALPHFYHLSERLLSKN